MDYFDNAINFLGKMFSQTKSTAADEEIIAAKVCEKLVEPEDVGNYLSALKKENQGVTIEELCKKFNVDYYEMAGIIDKLENAGTVIPDISKSVYQEKGELFYPAKYTGTKQ
ncbi:MAG: hypothetical protein KKB25_00775 [Nanoarchaeota archaeon]|nr:hypothetical protein [Nanoarchaeota archaeon]